ncbi:MAG: iron uptake porin [Spirulinaceae cyanobacterium]
MVALAFLIAPVVGAEESLVSEQELASQTAPESYLAQTPTEDSQLLNQINEYSTEGQGDIDPLEQVTSVTQLSDIDPFWFQAVQKMVDKYGCIVGYPDGTFKGNRNITRYEFAAALSRCMEWVEANYGSVEDGDLATLRRLVQEFEAELAVLGARVDDLEGRVAFVEDHQFSTTTKLKGEVIFGVSDAFGGIGDNTNTVFQDRVRLNLITSFTGKDTLQTRLQAGNVNRLISTNEGRFTYFPGGANNNVGIDILRYITPVGDKATVQIIANNGLHHYYTDTLNPYFESGAGGTGALSTHAERNPIYRLGPLGAGAAVSLRPAKGIRFDVGYLSNEASNPAEGEGLFGGNYSGIAQLTFGDRYKVAFTYVNSYSGAGDFLLGGVGTNLANTPEDAAGIGATPIITNAYGIETSLRFSESLILNGWVGKMDSRLIGRGDADIWTFNANLGFLDLGGEGNMLGLGFGAEPTLRGLEVDGATIPLSQDWAYHAEAFYKYKLSNNILITPGIIWLPSVNQDSDSEDVFIGTLRTTFTF